VIEIVLGVALVVTGVVLWIPATRLPFASFRDRMYRSLPWIQRVPGARSLYGDTGQKVVIRVIGLFLIVLGILLLFDLVEMR